MSAVFGLLVILGAPRRAPNQFLAFFLLLIAGNQAVEAYRAVASPTLDVLPFRVATVFAALDPFVLYYFASIYPRRSALNAPWRVALVAAPGVALAFATAGILPEHFGDLSSARIQAAWATYTSVVYTIVLVHLLRLNLEPDAGPEARLLFAAVAVAAIPTWARVPFYGLPLLHSELIAAAGGAPTWAAFVVFTIALAVAGSRWVARAAPSDRDSRRHVFRWALVGSLLGLVLTGAWAGDLLVLVGLAAVEPGEFLLALGRFSAAVRWILFGVLVSMAVLRHRMLGLALAARRRAARVLVALAFGGAAFAAISIAGAAVGADALFGLAPIELGVLAVVVAASQGFRTTVDRVAQRLYGVPMPGDLAASLEAYRRAAAEAAAEGRDAATDIELARLRDELGLDERTAAVVQRMAAAGPRSALEPGRVVAGRYRVERLVGRGSSGRAFLARDELIERAVVLKEVLHDGGSGDDAALREARVAGQLHHPNVVAVFDVVASAGASLVVAEYVAGASLEERLRADGPLPLADGLRVADGLLAGLAAVHAAGIVHRDLKPANVLLTEDGAAKIADFGVARVRGAGTVSLAAPDVFVGTPDFMAPEQRAGGVATGASDVYAVGLILRRVIAAPLPDSVERVLARALADDPARRWSSAREMRDALATAAVTPRLDDAA